MKRSIELFDEIESYLNGELSSEATEAFEKRMAEDTALSREVALHKSVHEELGETKELQFRELLNRIGQDQQISPKKRSFPWRIAASLAVLFAASFYIYFQTQSSDADLFEEYYTAYPVEDRLRGADVTKRDSVLALYTAKDYQKAGTALKNLLEESPEDSQLQLYYGNCLLNTGKLEEAIHLFESAPRENSAYENYQWYLALAQLKKDDRDAAVMALQKVVDYNGIYKQKANELLQELDL